MDELECSQCGGPLVPMGQLGRRKHYRCRNCGLDHSFVVEEDEDEYEDPDAE